jgi:thiamine-phosphate pyrophosphorylase
MSRRLIYYITDRRQLAGDERERRRALLAKIREAALAGVDCIQLREKDLTTRELEQLSLDAIDLLAQLKTQERELRTSLLINSRTDIALAVNADGVHLRSGDIGISDVRSVWAEAVLHNPQLSPAPKLAVSCHTPDEIFHAAKAGADFAVFAPVFEKRDQPNSTPAGLGALREACRATVPVLALGGVTSANAASCLEAGAAGIAGIRLFQENRVEEVVRALRQL